MQQLGTMGSHAFGPPRVGPFAGGSFGYSGAGSGIYGPNMSALRNSLGGALSGMAGGWGSSTLSSSPSSSLAHLPPLSSSGSLLPPPPSTSSASSAHDHNAIALAQAFQTRLAALSTVAASLLSKREAIAMQLARVQSRAEDVARTREAIEAETLADTEAVLHRLRAVESSKQAILQHDAEGLASDIATIDRFYAALTSYQPQNNNGMIPQSTSNAGAGATAISSGGAPPPSSPLYDTHLALDFMRAYPELCAEADRLTAKTVRQDIDVRSDDFERETASRIDLASKYQALVDLVAAKDRIILQMLREREAVLRERESARDSVLRASSERDQAVEKISQERDAMLRLKDTDVAEWTKLVDVLTGQLVEATEKLARAQGISASSASASSQQQQQQQQNSQLYGTISPSTSLRIGTGGGSGNASISAVYGSGGGARYGSGSGGGGGGNQIQNTPPPSNSSQQFRGLSQQQQQQQQQQLMHQNLPPPPMVQGSNQGGGSAFIAKRYQEIIRSTNGGERSLGVGTALPLSLHPALYSRPPASNSQFSSLATAIPVPAVRSDEAVAFNEYLARSRAGHVPFPESTSKVNNLGLVLPDQGLLQPSPVPEGTPGRIISNMTPPPPPPLPVSGGTIPVSVPSSSSGSVPPSPKWQGETTTAPTAVPVPVVPTVSLTTPSTIVTETDPLISVPSIPPPSAGGEVLNDQPTTNINTTA